MRRKLMWTIVALLMMAAGAYRWTSLHKDDQGAVELWGRMNKAAQEKLASEINRSFIKLHPECWRSALDIQSYPEALVIKVKCSHENNRGNNNVELIKYTAKP